MSSTELLLIAVVALFALMAYRMMPVKGIAAVSAEELQERLGKAKKSESQFIDVREPFEYQAGHVPGFRNVPLSQLKNRMQDIDKSKDVVVMCRSGARSMQAAKLLKKNGVPRVLNVTGGISRWTGKVEK